MSERYWLLKSCALLTAVSADDLRRLEARSRVRRFRTGELVYLPSDAADGVLLLAEGRIRIDSTSPEGKRAILAYVDPGELFGELAMFGGETRDELADAMAPSLVVSLPREEVLRIMNENPGLAVGITKLIGLRRQRIERRLKSLLFRSVRQRLVELLLELAERYGRPTPEGVVIELRLSHQELASAIGSTRESVTLMMGELTDEGLVGKRRSRIILCATEMLRKQVAGDAKERHKSNRRTDSRG